VRAIELCKTPGSSPGDRPLSVRLLPGNRRTMSFHSLDDPNDNELETEVQCVGEPAPQCQANSCVDCPCKFDVFSQPLSYVDLMLKDIAPRCRQNIGMGDKKLRVLLIGLGGGALPQFILHRCPAGTVAIDAIELDGRVIDAAQRFFGVASTRGTLNIEQADALAAVTTSVEKGKQYDVALVDCMAGGGLVPESCRSSEFIGLIHKSLAPGGVVMQNIWHYAPTAPEQAAREYKSTKDEYARQFGGVDVLRPVNPPELDWEDILRSVKGRQ